MLLRSSEPLCICSGRISCGLEESAMRWRGYNYKRQRPWIPDQVRDDRRGEEALAGLRPRTTWGRNTCGVAAPHDLGEKYLRGCGPARLGGEILAGLRPRATRGNFAGSRPRTPRSFCFGKRTQNQGRPGVALLVPLPRSRKVRAAELATLKQSSPLNRVRDWGAATPGGGAMGWRGVYMQKTLDPRLLMSRIVNVQ